MDHNIIYAEASKSWKMERKYSGNLKQDNDIQKDRQNVANFCPDICSVNPYPIIKYTNQILCTISYFKLQSIHANYAYQNHCTLTLQNYKPFLSHVHASGMLNILPDSRYQGSITSIDM